PGPPAVRAGAARRSRRPRRWSRGSRPAGAAVRAGAASWARHPQPEWWAFISLRRQHDFKGRAWPAIVQEAQHAAMLIHNLSHDGKPEADASGFRGEKGVEDLLAQLTGHARAGVAEFDPGAAAGGRGRRDAQPAAAVAH